MTTTSPPVPLDPAWDVVGTATRLSGRSDVDVRAIPYDLGSPATAGVFAVTAGEQRWFVKVLRDVALWPGLRWMPEPAQREFVAMFPWRSELDLHRAGLAAVVPPPGRVARLLHVEEPDPQHVVLWAEWLDLSDTAWTDEDFVRAARLLGHLAAARRPGEPVNERLPPLYLGGPNFGLRYYVERRVLDGIGAQLADDALWRHPVLLAATGGDPHPLRTAMITMHAELPALLTEYDGFPQCQPHGDASPQNLLRTVDDPDTFVVTDWGMGGYHAVGFDLGQLVVGLAHAGELSPSRIAALLRACSAAYAAGLADGGWAHPRELVQRGGVLAVLLRSALTAIPFEDLDGAGVEKVADRVRLTEALLALR